MGSSRSWLVGAAIRAVQIANERMGFGQGVVCGVSSEGRGDHRRVPRKPAPSICAGGIDSVVILASQLSERHPLPPAPSRSAAGVTHNFSPLFINKGDSNGL